MNQLEKLQEELRGENIDAVLVSSYPNIIYLTSYLGFSADEREAFLLITRNASYIFTDSRYSEAVQEKIIGFNLIEISAEYPFSKKLLQIIQKEKIIKCAIEKNNLTVSEYETLQKTLGKKMLFVPSDNFVENMRLIKTNEEILKIEKACKIADKTFKFIIENIKEGITERALAFKIECFIKEKGADLSFKSIVAFGKNSSIPHHLSGNAKLKKGDIVLLDFGAKIDSYCSDMTRTLFLGKANDKQKKMYQTALIAQQKAIDFLNSKLIIYNSKPKPIKASDIDKVARNYITSQGYPTIPHSLGHGAGIEIHEQPKLSPNSNYILKEGMVFSIEPGIYIPNFGGVRIEDLVTINNGKLKILTKSNKNLIQL